MSRWSRFLGWGAGTVVYAGLPTRPIARRGPLPRKVDHEDQQAHCRGSGACEPVWRHRCDQDTDSHRRYAQGFLLDKETVDWFFAHYIDVQDRGDWRFAPLNAPDHSGVAPAWLGLAECDPLIDEGIAYADVLRMAGVPVDLEIYRGVIHGFVTMGRAIGLTRQAHADAARALVSAWQSRPMSCR